MQTWCIYIDEAGVANVPDFLYAAICIPFNSQQEFSKSYSRIVRPLIPISGREIKYTYLLNVKDHHYDVHNANIFKELLNCFLDIDGTVIIRVKAKKKKMLQKGHDIRSALFRRTLLLCKEFLPVNHHAMILHDELDSRDQQGKLPKKFYSVNRETLFQFQNCVFVQSNENPFIQFADFVVSICHRHNFFLHKKYKDREHSETLVKMLFKEIDKNDRCPPIVELTDHKDVRGTPRRIKALELVSEHGIDPSTAYVVVDKKMTLEEALRRKNRTSTIHKQNIKENSNEIN